MRARQQMRGGGGTGEGGDGGGAQRRLVMTEVGERRWQQRVGVLHKREAERGDDSGEASKLGEEPEAGSAQRHALGVCVDG